MKDTKTKQTHFSRRDFIKTTTASTLGFNIIIMIIAEITTQAAQTGIGLGAAIAVVCSWDRNRSILWAILAGFLSWIHVIYFALTRK